jgi:hypothetical protein
MYRQLFVKYGFTILALLKQNNKKTETFYQGILIFYFEPASGTECSFNLQKNQFRLLLTANGQPTYTVTYKKQSLFKKSARGLLKEKPAL